MYLIFASVVTLVPVQKEISRLVVCDLLVCKMGGTVV